MAKPRNFLKSFKNALKSSSDFIIDPSKPARDYVQKNIKNQTVNKVLNKVNQVTQSGKNIKNRKLGLGVSIMESYADADRKQYPNTEKGKKMFKVDSQLYLNLKRKNKKKK